MLLPAMSVQCTMTCPPMRMPLGERDYCFFVVRRVSRGNLELTTSERQRSRCVSASCGASPDRRASEAAFRPRHRLAIRNYVDVVLLTSCTESRRAIGHAARSGPGVRQANQGSLAIVGT